MPLYAFGSNGSGQLGIGHVDDVSIPTRCLFEGPEPEPLSNQSLILKPAHEQSPNGVLRIAAGGNHTLLLLPDGTVYAAGCNEDGRCGVSPGDPLLKFRRVVIHDPESECLYATFKDVSASWEGTFLVERQGERLFVLGSGAKGELGLGEGYVRALGPRCVTGFRQRIVSVASGMGHTVVVLENGDVYGWGGARKGQLGEDAKGRKIVWTPVRVEGVPFRATGAACGREFTVVTGDRSRGEFVVLGSQGDRWGILSGPPLVTGYGGIAASWHGVYVHRGEGFVVAWGRNDRGQLPPADLPVVRELAVGSEHVLALVDGGKVVAFGWGEHGNCGPVADKRGDVKGRYIEIPVPGEEGSEVVGVGAGCATSWVVMS
ncbi:regulator of chromosome condensation 1/beta-lactamase-inhibitor protein II [Aspergillus leporis]|uniref:Regulator of chromosome condensation 1/beta-lactamase-inhibitor protein II n=1 Tax=Aspergillus leporis TaxID=41062 RepID=A0A5N5WZB3_9EURO|nr:regulator of chromosome condensation 1/beta-lactamase-inhibitor protein II [Aspergillus leporis]